MQGYLGLFIMLLIVGSAILFLQFAFLSLPAWGLGIAAGALALYVLQEEYLDTQDSDSVINKSVSFYFDGEKISYHISSFDYKKCPQALYHVRFSVLVCGIIALGTLLLLYGTTGYFSTYQFWGYDEPMGAQLSFVLSCMPSAGLIYYWYWNVDKNFNTRISGMIETRIAALNLSMDTGGERHILKTEIKKLCKELKVPIADEYTISINDFIESNSDNMLSNDIRNKFEQRHEAEVNNARIYRDNLSTALKLMENAKAAYTGAEDPVYKTGNNMFYDQLVKGFEALNSKNLTDLIEDKKWDEYEDMINMVIEFLSDLKIHAENYEPGNYQGYNQGGANSGPKSNTMTKKEAYKTLEIPEGSSIDVVQRAFIKLIKECHPNFFMNQPEWVRQESLERSKKLSQARDVIIDKPQSEWEV